MLSSHTAVSHQLSMMQSTDSLLEALKVLYYLSPSAVAFYFICATTLAACTLQTPRENGDNKKWRRIALWILSFIVFSFLAEGIVSILVPFAPKPKAYMIYVWASPIVWGSMTISLAEIKNPVWNTFLGAFAIGGVFEVAIVGLMFAISTFPEDFIIIFRILLSSIRVILLATSVISGLCMAHTSRKKETQTDEESRPLLENEVNGTEAPTESNCQYGSLPSSASAKSGDDDSEYNVDDEEDKEMKELQRKRLQEEGGWWGYLKGFMIFLPYIWPYNNSRMQLWLVVMLLAITAERFLTVLIPRQLGIITDALAGSKETGYYPWKELIVWAALQLISVSAGFDLLRSMASFRIGCYSYKQLSSAAFNHVMGLSMDYHTAKSSGDLLKAIEQGSDIHNILETVLFDAGPMLIDLVVAAVYLSTVFDAYMSLIIIATCGAYIYAGVRGNKFITSTRREYNDSERKENEILYDSVSNWQTVAYHNRRDYEQERFLQAADNHVTKEVRYWDVASYLDTVQSFILALGLLAASLIAAYRISANTAPVGSFVLLVTYWNYIQSPLSRLAWTLRHTSSQLISAERLLQLLQTKPSVADKPGAPDLVVKEGRVTFADVSFAYDKRKPTLKDVSLTAEPGQTIALVGETGGGKSTILKLLLRFYDVTEGSISIDGRDIRDVTLDSLRSALGVVPQDPALFNQTIMENIRYARLDAMDDEVYDACKAAAVHDKIVSFPDGYASKVGERGVRLSGGELQRIAIARVILKEPQIVLLDEATSAVDSSTEAQIQEAFRKLSAGRTTFVIAHRLSTVMSADLILVIDEGRVVERGTHLELLRIKGKYVDLWSKQTSKEGDGNTDLLIADVPGRTAPTPSPRPSSRAESGEGDERDDAERVTQQSGR